MTKCAADLFLKYSATLATWGAKLQVALGVIGVAAGIIGFDWEIVGRSATCILVGLVIWPITAWIRDCAKPAGGEK